MKIAIMGAGAIGGYFGGLLARSGQDVTLIARGSHLEAIQTVGLKIRSATSGHFVVNVPAIEYPNGSWQADLIIFCVKTYGNTKAMEVMAPIVGQDTVILTLQNGVTNEEELAMIFGKDKVMIGATYIDSSLEAPGLVVQAKGPCRIVFGESSGNETIRSQAAFQAFRNAGIDTKLSHDMTKDLWTKFLFICGFSGMVTSSRSSMAEILDHHQSRAVLVRVIEEVIAVGRARMVNLDEMALERTLESCKQFRNGVSSMRFDLENQKRLEIDALNGTVVRLGDELGIDTPCNDVIYACLKLADEQAKQRSFK